MSANTRWTREEEAILDAALADGLGAVAARVGEQLGRTRKSVDSHIRQRQNRACAFARVRDAAEQRLAQAGVVRGRNIDSSGILSLLLCSRKKAA